MDNRATFLQNVLVKPGQENAAVAALHGRHPQHGVELLEAYVETGAGFTYRLASGEVGDTGDRRILTSLWLAPEDFVGAIEQWESYADEVTVRRVESEVVIPLSAETLGSNTRRSENRKVVGSSVRSSTFPACQWSRTHSIAGEHFPRHQPCRRSDVRRGLQW